MAQYASQSLDLPAYVCPSSTEILATPLDKNDHFRQDSTCWEDLFLGGQQQGAGPQRSSILRFPSIYAYTAWHKTTKFDVATRGRELVFRVSVTPPPQMGGVSALPNGGSFLP